MSGVDGRRTDGTSNDERWGDRARAIALIQSLYVELAGELRAVAWDANDPELLYVRSTVDRPWALQAAFRRRGPTYRQPLEDVRVRSFEYAIDAFEGVFVVIVAAGANGLPGLDRTIGLSVDRNGATVRDVTTAIERSIEAYCARR